MARNGSGTYSKVNTFVAANTVTAAGHNQNWDDLVSEVTNSVAADGQTTITAALKGFAGTVSAPGYAFSSDTNTGIYRIGADNLGVAANGAKVLDVSATGLGVTGTLVSSGAVTATATSVTAGTTLNAGTLLLTGDGAVGAPAHSFTGDTDCGAYRIGANNIGYAVNGAKVLDIATTGLGVTGALTTTTSATIGSGFTVSAGAVSLPAASVAAAALAAPSARVKLATNSPSGAASSTFESLISATYRSYEFEFSDIIVASGTPNLIMQVGTGGGPTYDTGSNYHYTYAAIGGGNVTNANSAGTTSFLITPLVTTVGQGASGVIRLFVPNGAAAYKPINYHSHNATTAIVGSGRYLSITAVTAVRFLTSTGVNLTGTIVMYGIT